MIGPIRYSIVVPTHGRMPRLMRCLDAIAGVSGSGVETVVVDDGSPDGVSGAVSQHAVRPRVVRTTNRGPAAARNTGAVVARGDVLIFLDDDCRPTPGLISSLDEALGRNPGAIVGGRTVNAARGSLPAEATQTLMDAVYQAQTARTNGRPIRLSTSILAVPRQRFLELGGFDEAFARPGGEDYEFCERWQRSGHAAVFEPDLIVEHDHPESLLGFWRQHANYGRGLHRVRSLGRRSSGVTGGAKGVREIIPLVVHPLRRQPGVRGLVLAGLVAFAQVATAWGMVRERIWSRKGEA